MTRITAYISILATLLAQPVWAQSAVTLRTNQHTGYTRAVFDWPSSVPYTLKESAPGEIVVTFSSHSNLSVGVRDEGTGSGIKDISQVSGPGEDLAVKLDITPGSRYRHFLIGNRVVVDVYDGSTGSAKQANAAPKPAPKEASKEEAKEEPKEKPVAITPAKDAVKPEEKPVITGHDGPPVKAMKSEEVQTETVAEQPPPKSFLEQAAPAFAPHLVTVTATEAVGIAAFVRSGNLWIVADRADLNVPPQIVGDHADKFSPFERVEVQGGVAYRTKLPAESARAHLYGEGGGLVWRVVITSNERETKPVEMKRNYERDNQVRGASVAWPFTQASRQLSVTDPSVGDVIEVVAVKQADQFAGPERHMVDFDLLQSVIGLAVVPKADDLKVDLSADGVEVSRPPVGLAISPIRDVSRSRIREEIQDADEPEAAIVAGEEMRRIFDFDRWMMGSLQALEENQRILLANMAPKDKSGQVQDLLTLAKMNVSNDRGQEAVGFLSYAEDLMPEIAESPEFIALRGASAALAGKLPIAFRDLFIPSLKEYGELDYWRAYTLAGLEDWQQAIETMPQDFTVLMGYPRPLLEKIGIKLAEVALRSGDVATAESVLATLNKERDLLKPWTIAAMDYLKGEAHRQRGETTEAEKLWKGLVAGKDDFYRAKAGLALTMLELERGDIVTDQAIDRLEGLRYAWRGDELEARINFVLGKLYIEKDQYMKGFTILRDAASMSPDTDIAKEITVYMQDEFYDLLMNDKDLSPIDAVEVFEEFRELTPAGEPGNKLVQRLAERLVQADLLDRAAKMLAHQVDFRLDGDEKARVALRLGAIDLINKEAAEAMKYLDLSRSLYGASLTGNDRTAKLKEIDMLRARGLSQLNRTEEALELLNGFDPDPTVNRLRADIAWQAGLWEDAAEALQDLILDQAIDLNRPLTPEQADLILNEAVALNLSGNRVELNNTRRRYEDTMKKTKRARLFDIVTRPRKTSILADKETIDSIVGEVDMFEDFLKTYRNDAGAASN